MVHGPFCYIITYQYLNGCLICRINKKCREFDGPGVVPKVELPLREFKYKKNIIFIKKISINFTGAGRTEK
jgi:hypothetical protein